MQSRSSVKMLTSYLPTLLGLLAVLVAAFGRAQPAEAPAVEPNQDSRWAAAEAAMLRGPQSVKLLDQAKLELPAGYGFVPKPQAAALMESMGNRVDERFIGLVFPLGDPPQDWFVSVDYEASGYIEDDDARDWDADELLTNLREGTEASNEHRVATGGPALQVTRWLEPPKYEGTLHHLVWAAEVQLKDKPDPNPGVNYNTYVLGREGYLSMNLITSVATVEHDKPAARALLQAVSFDAGKRYTDFNSSTDKIAAYGLAALVGGLAVKKLGLFALAAAFLAKFAKAGILIAIAAAAAVRRFWKRTPKSE